MTLRSFVCCVRTLPGPPWRKRVSTTLVKPSQLIYCSWTVRADSAHHRHSSTAIEEASQTSDESLVRVAKLENENERLRRQLAGERRARIAAQARLRRGVEKDIAENGWLLKPIAHVQSPFHRRFGTPRQSLLAPSVCGKIVFDPMLISQEALTGLDEFSHLWCVCTLVVVQ